MRVSGGRSQEELSVMSVPNASRQLRPRDNPSPLARLTGLSILLLLPAVLTAQTVTVPPIAYPASLTFGAAGEMYFPDTGSPNAGRYVAHTVDYGFIWLD